MPARAGSPPSGCRSPRRRSHPTAPDGRTATDRRDAGNGSLSITTSDSVLPGTSTPWNNPVVANRQVSCDSANFFTSAGLGRSRWVRTGTETLSLTASTASSIADQLVNSASVRPPAASISAISSSATAARNLGDLGGGRCIAQYSIACDVVVERAADVELGRVRLRQPDSPGERRRDRRAREDRGVLLPHARGQRRADIERSDLEARVLAAARHERHRAVAGAPAPPRPTPSSG